jgi:hypothetical protein
MRKTVFLYAWLILIGVGFSQYYANGPVSGGLYAQTDGTTSQKNIKKEKKKRMREAANADRAALKRHQDIQTKATRKRMKKHLRQTKKNVQNSHR